MAITKSYTTNRDSSFWIREFAQADARQRTTAPAPAKVEQDNPMVRRIDKAELWEKSEVKRERTLNNYANRDAVEAKVIQLFR